MNTYFFVLWPDGRLNKAQALIDDAIDLAAGLADQRQEAFSLLWAGVSATEQGDYQRAGFFLEQSRDKWPENDRHSESALPLVFLGEIAMFEGDFASAESLFEAAISPFREAKDYPFIGMVDRRLGQLALRNGHLDQAITLVRESLVSNWGIHDYRGIGACLSAYAAVNIAERKFDRAVKLFGVVDALLESIQIPLLPYDQHEYEQNVSRLQAPVLSEQITVVEPSVSTAGRWRITARCLAILETPSARVIVTAAGNPSGIAPTARAIAAIMVSTHA